MKRFRWVAGLVALAAAFLLVFSVSGFGARLDKGIDLVTDVETGRTWVADSHYAVRSGRSSNVLMHRERALSLIKAMNAGDVENFGYRDWRLSSIPELHRVLKLEASFGDLSELRAYLDGFADGSPGAISGRDSGKLMDDLVYPWPVRGQGVQTGAVEPGFGDVVLFATNSIWLQTNSQVLSGDIVVNEPSTGLTLSCFGRELCVSWGATTPAGTPEDPWAIKADSIRTRVGSVVGGEAFCNDLVHSGDPAGLACTPLGTDPVFASLPEFKDDDPPSSSPNITVGFGQEKTLEPGDYGVIKVKAYGTLRFTGGIYNVKRIDARISSDLLFQARSQVRVSGRFSADLGSFVGPEQGSGLSASDIVFYVDGANGFFGFIFGLPKAAMMGIGSTLEANMYVPNGSLWLMGNSSSKGAFLARDVILGIGADATLDSAFSQVAPVATDDAFTLEEGGTVDSFALGISVLDNDFDPNPDDTITLAQAGPSHFEVVTTSNGSLTLNPDGTFIYQHDGGDSSSDSFTYQICDDGDPVLCDEGTATFTIDSVNDAPTADSVIAQVSDLQTVTITMTGNDPEADDLRFTIVSPPDPLVGSLGPVVEGPPPAPGVPPGCGPGQCTTDPIPPRSSATVDYTPVTLGETSFTFQVDDQNGGTATGVVTINPADNEPEPGQQPPDDPTDTVVAFDAEAEVVKNGSVLLTLVAEAPCDPTGAANPDVPCDGIGDDVPLTFSIVGGTPLTTADNGTVDNLVQGSEVPQRTATVSYSPTADFVHDPLIPGDSDSFDFQACGIIDSVQVCDTATVTVVVVEPVPLAEDIGSSQQPVEVQTSAETEITLIGNSGGTGTQPQSATFRVAGKISFRAVGIADADAVGSVTDSDGNGDGDATVGPRNVAVLENTADLSSPSLDNVAADLNSFYNGLPSVSSTLISGDVTSLSGVGLFAVPVPDDAFTTAEITLMSNFLAGGGTLLFMGENQASVFDTANNAINAALSSLGSNMSIVAPGVADGGTQTATVGNGQILSDPLTSGVNNFDYAAPSGVSAVAGGTTSLFLLTDLATTFVAKESVGGGLIVLSGDANIINTGVGPPIPADNGVFFQNLLNPATVTAGFDGLAERRIQIEFDILDGLSPLDLSSARVTLQTVKGAGDSLDTLFFAGTAEQDGAITPSDFQAPAQEIQGVVMPASGAVGTEDSFEIDVLSAVLDAIDRDPLERLSVFSLQGRVDRTATGQGLSVRTDILPVFEFSTPPPIFIPPLVFSITSLPAGAILLDSTGQQVIVGEPLPSPQVTVVSGGTTGSTSFTYQVAQDGVVDSGTVFLLLVDNCVSVGRPPGCSPDN